MQRMHAFNSAFSPIDMQSAIPETTALSRTGGAIRSPTVAEILKRRFQGPFQSDGGPTERIMNLGQLGVGAEAPSLIFDKATAHPIWPCIGRT
jgi:hypothetical protein